VNKFEERFLELLAEKNLSQRAFAKKYKIPYTTVNGWCNGSEPSYDNLMLVADIFNKSIDYLLGRKD